MTRANPTLTMPGAEAPTAARCSFCHSYQPLIRHEVWQPDDYVQVYRFFCDTTHEAKWLAHEALWRDLKRQAERHARGSLV